MAQESAAQRAAQERLERAVQLIDTNPKLAARKLEQLHVPTAEMYLAYLYLARKVTVPNALSRVDHLMHKAMSSAQEKDGDIQNLKHYHYKDLEKLLRNIRFAAADVPVPMSIAKEHTAEFCKAFNSYWGCSRDAFPQMGSEDVRYDIGSIPAVRNYLFTV